MCAFDFANDEALRMLVEQKRKCYCASFEASPVYDTEKEDVVFSWSQGAIAIACFIFSDI